MLPLDVFFRFTPKTFAPCSTNMPPERAQQRLATPTFIHKGHIRDLIDRACKRS